jgi:hypothetical protein
MVWYDVRPVMEAAMVDYRVYYINRDGHICAVEELTCADDDEAIMAFERCASDRPMELWRLDRRIKTYSPPQTEEMH